ncbi:HAD domain-containing protein [Paraburkholderia agricolaris]|uniref:HAD domain-containing protein n=1 Tax=Paraburkholderia agricolaris TaxID=2152888 RepID=A0ABW8ZJX6_9BURK
MKHATPPPIQERTTPTLFLDFDGTLHVGHAVVDVDGHVSLESGRPLFEYAPLLVKLLAPYPAVEIVLTTSWLDAMTDETVFAYLPPELSRRVIDATRGRRPRLSYMLNGSGRTDVITCYAFGKGLTQWLAIDDSVYGAYHFGREPGQLIRNFLLLDSSCGISDEGAQQRIREWLVEAHKVANT